jgi:hypothetical protein
LESGLEFGDAWGDLAVNPEFWSLEHLVVVWNIGRNDTWENVEGELKSNFRGVRQKR